MIPDGTKRYFCYSLDHDEEEAKEDFDKRFGFKPSQVFQWRTLLWVGPVDDVTERYTLNSDWKGKQR